MSRIRPVLRHLHSPDIDLESYRPDEEDCFGFSLQACFGSTDDIGEESFGIIVCTPKWLEREIGEGEIVSGRHHLIVRNYDLAAIRRFLLKYTERCEGATWDEAANKLGRLGLWEFEDYTR